MSGIKGLMQDEMPQEKLIKHGPAYLTDVELLAILLRVGTKGKNVLELSRDILDKFGISLVSRKTYKELLEFKGINKVKATQIVALFELSRRFSNLNNCKNVKLNSSLSVFDYVKSDFYNLNFEKVLIVYVDTKNNLIKKDFLFEGSINYSIIEPRKIIKEALIFDASGFFIIHNHPSGDLTPSEDDINITKRIKIICDKINIRFLDHIIISNNNYYSMFDNDVIL